MNDLVTWLREQLNMDEQAANDVMRIGLETLVPGAIIDKSGATVFFTPEVYVRVIDALNPTRVLAEAEAKRRIIELHEHSSKDEVVWIEQKPGPRISRSGDLTTTLWPTAVEPGRWQKTGRTLYGCNHCERDSQYDIEYSGWCETVRLLATAYADREGYDEAWKPDID